jgi:hypothetical protein
MMKLLVTTILSLAFSFHDFHVTHTTLFYDSSNASIEIAIKVAVEDLERALEDQGAEYLRIGTNRENEAADQLIKNYFKQNLKLFPNAEAAEYHWVGKEISEDLHDLYIYFEMLDCNDNAQVETLLVENTIFTEILSNQVNIVLIEFGESKHNLTFTKAQSKQRISLKDE